MLRDNQRRTLKGQGGRQSSQISHDRRNKLGDTHLTSSHPQEEGNTGPEEILTSNLATEGRTSRLFLPGSVGAPWTISLQPKCSPSQHLRPLSTMERHRNALAKGILPQAPRTLHLPCTGSICHNKLWLRKHFSSTLDLQSLLPPRTSREGVWEKSQQRGVFPPQ